MDAQLTAYGIEWLGLLGRWVHVITGIAWIGASFYFVWLDNHLLDPAEVSTRDKGVIGELWAVHGGGFYNPQKYGKAGPAEVPAHLHWFYWEAYSTWLSGFFMLCLLYYGAPSLYLIDPNVLALSAPTAIAIGLATLAGGWLIYDGLCRSPLGGNDRALGIVLALLLCVASWGLCKLFSGRGAFIHFGAMLGTIMVANVFFVIIPGQRKMVTAIAAGHMPDPIHGLRGKQRSVHNTYFTLPVLFTMISNHYAMTWGAPRNWLVLIGLCFAGAAIRAWFVARHRARERGGRTPFLPAMLGVIAIVIVAWTLRPAPHAAVAGGAAKITFEQIQPIVAQRCAVCHAEHPTFASITEAPKGVRLDTQERIRAQAAAMQVQVSSRAMPIGNLTQITDDERALLLAWLTQETAR